MGKLHSMHSRQIVVMYSHYIVQYINSELNIVNIAKGGILQLRQLLNLGTVPIVVITSLLCLASVVVQYVGL